MTKQLTIAARDHGETALDEPDDAVSQSGSFPVFGTNAFDAIDDIGDLAIRRAIHVAVRRLQHEAVAPPLLERQPAWSRDGPPMQRAQQALERFDPVRSVRVKRHERGEWAIGRDAGKTDQPNGLAASLEEEMHALLVRPSSGLAQLGGESACRRQDVWRVREQHGAGVRLGAPVHRTLASIQRRRDEKTAGPIFEGARVSGKDCRRAHSPVGIPYCA